LLFERRHCGCHVTELGRIFLPRVRRFVDVGFDFFAGFQAVISDNKVRIIATSCEHRNPLLKDVPVGVRRIAAGLGLELPFVGRLAARASRARQELARIPAAERSGLDLRQDRPDALSRLGKLAL